MKLSVNPIHQDLTYNSMRFLLLPFLASLLFFASCKKNSGGDPIPNNQALTWAKTFGGGEYDFAYTIIQASNGDYVIAGNTRSTDGDVPGSRVGYDAWVARIDINGNKIWSQAHGGADDEYATGVAQAADGGFILVGYSFNTGQNRAWAMKVSGTGDKVWEKPLSASTDAMAMAIVPSGDGAFMVAGYEAGAGGRNGMIAKITEAGDISWSRTYGGNGDDRLHALVRASDGSFVAAGHTNSTSGDVVTLQGGFDGWLLKVSGTGDLTWTKSFGGAAADRFKSLVQAPDGGFLAAGESESNGGDVPGSHGELEAWVVKVDGSGTKQWSKAYGGANEEHITSVVNIPGGGYMMLGYTNSTTGDVVRTYNDFGGWLVKMDATGNKTGTSTYGENNTDDFGNAMTTSSDGGYIIAGHRDVPGRGYDGWLVKVASF